MTLVPRVGMKISDIAVLYPNENKSATIWSKYFDDYVEVKEKRKGWINVYPYSGDDVMYNNKEIADRYAGSARIACVEIEYEVP